MIWPRYRPSLYVFKEEEIKMFFTFWWPHKSSRVRKSLRKCDALNGWDFSLEFPSRHKNQWEVWQALHCLGQFCCAPEMWYSPFSFLSTWAQGVISTATNYGTEPTSHIGSSNAWRKPLCSLFLKAGHCFCILHFLFSTSKMNEWKTK